MSGLAEVIKTLTPNEIERLRKSTHSGNALGRLLQTCLDDPGLRGAALQERLKLTPGMLNKLESQALDIVYEAIKQEQPNSYDDIILVRQLLYRGLVKQARRLAVQLEKIYLGAPRYAALDALYHEAIRVAYHAGDEAWLRELAQKATGNAHAHAVYNRLDKQLILNMLRVERKQVPKAEEQAFLEEMLRLEAEVERLPHPVLKVNTLYILHLFYINTYDLMAAAGAVSRLEAYIRMSDKLLEDKYVHIIALSIVFYFYCRFDTGEEPGEERRKNIESLIGYGGALELMEYYFNLFQYYFFTGKEEAAKDTFHKMQEMHTHTRFSILVTVASACLHFEEGDLKAFRKDMSGFYEQNYMEFREAEIHLRFMEVLLLHEGDASGTESRLESLRKFIERSAAGASHEEIQVLKHLKKFVKSNNVESREPFLYQRSMKYFLGYLKQAALQ